MNINEGDMKKVLEIIASYEEKIDFDFQMPLEEYEERYRKVWKKLEEQNIDFGFFFWYREMAGDGIYLTGYNPNIERAAGIIAPGKRPLILAGPESGVLAQQSGLDLPIKFVYEFSIPEEYYEGIEREYMHESIVDYLGEEKVNKIGYLSSLNLIPAEFVDHLRKDYGGAEVVDAADILEDLRYEKSPNEFKCMETADIIACAAVRAMLAVAKPGVRESELAAIGDFTAKALGCEGYGFETIVNSGYRCRTMIGPASNKIIEEGEIAQIGISPDFKGYKGVSRRAFVMGERSAIQQDYFATMNKGYELAEKELYNVCENDLPSNRIDLAPRNFFATQEVDGYNMKQFHIFSTCHGTGLTECLEPMVITPTKEEKYGENVGIMMDLGCYGHPNDQIAGGCVENAFHKRGNKVVKCSDLPIDVQHLVGKGLD